MSTSSANLKIFTQSFFALRSMESTKIKNKEIEAWAKGCDNRCMTQFVDEARAEGATRLACSGLFRISWGSGVRPLHVWPLMLSQRTSIFLVTMADFFLTKGGMAKSPPQMCHSLTGIDGENRVSDNRCLTRLMGWRTSDPRIHSAWISRAKSKTSVW